jgi:hypothetical protein
VFIYCSPLSYAVADGPQDSRNGEDVYCEPKVKEEKSRDLSKEEEKEEP